MNIHFKLRKQGQLNPVIVMHVFDSRFNWGIFSYSTGIRLEPSHWDKRKHRVKLLIVKAKEYRELNKYLDHLEETVREFESEHYLYDSLYRSDLKFYILRKRINPVANAINENEETNFFFETWNKIIEESRTSRGERTTEDTKKQKRQAMKLVQKFVAEKQVRLTFANVDMNFYHAFDNYMLEKNYNGNSRGRNFKEIKALLREAVDRDIPVNTSFQKKSFKVIRNATDSTYLKESELRKLMTLNLPETLAPIRDIFVMACFVGARHSDWPQIRKANIVLEDGKELIKIKQKKTRELVHVPIHPVVRNILNKYAGDPPKVISNQKFNEALKSICQQADLGRIMIDGEIVEKWGEISTHTARRSFATNAYLSRSLEVYQIMKCTGHKTEASFLAYLKLNGRDYAIRAAESKFFRDESWTDKLQFEHSS